ncbi:NAD(P)-dependent oxidoreductase [Propylenella binzhouense]|uniref:NAD(P)-dependent oxidoreductase n=1 Tax=Propylenella binzhouense TaxID=2555902 RepID=A0A964T6Z9_9HYPH|nr:NAD(P)-dependent oxidoreductase [Propylenella binzhouense]MYZ49575.1 NAD(P)-dependent oxidoreductase [Propylenella binzhouense]
MSPSVAIIAPGRMGSGLGRRLAEAGLEVRTSLAGRSAASAERARAAGMRPVADEEIAAADLVLSVVPPAEAVAAAERLAVLFRRSGRTPLYVDLNAISPETSGLVGQAVGEAGCRYVDGCIIGLPPAPGYRGPFLHLSGEHAGAAGAILAAGLDVTVLDGPNGSASALKMCFGGIMKGITAIASAMFLTASRTGAADAVRQELARSQPELLAWFSRQIPAMYPKTYRWVAEMEEVAAFAGADREVAAVYEAVAKLFARLSAGSPAAAADLAALDRLFGGLDGGSGGTALAAEPAPPAPPTSHPEARTQ